LPVPAGREADDSGGELMHERNSVHFGQVCGN
jgi:hypothetical protein